MARVPLAGLRRSASWWCRRGRWSSDSR